MSESRPEKRRTFLYREIACEEKASYTQSEARHAIRGMGKRGKKVHAYRCPFCKQFHLTSR